jgi:hypothetical protein
MEASEMSKKEKKVTKSIFSTILGLLSRNGKYTFISSYELNDAKTPEELKKVFDRFSKK